MKEKNILDMTHKGLLIVGTILFLIIIFLIVEICRSKYCFMLIFDKQGTLDLLIALLTITIASSFAVFIYKQEFSDTSERIIKKEIKLIEAVLSELNELVRNTCENIDASKKSIEIRKAFPHNEQLKVLTEIKEEDFKKYKWNIVINTYFSSSLENYLHNNRHSKKEIIYYANRVRKMAELINNNRAKSKITDVINWTRELNIYCYALKKEFFKLAFVKENIRINEYEFLVKLEKEFWNNRETMKRNNVNKKIIEKIENE